ncbi:MAG: thioredoxin family protein [Geminicoccaceae bacterium]
MPETAFAHPVVAHDEWLAARKALLAEEKALTRARDRLNEARRALPWERVTKDYRFAGEGGPVTLAGLFGQNGQLVLYHFMFGPGWSEGCKSCSLLADHLDGIEQHLRHHDVTLAAVSLAPLAELLPFKARMGWRFPWVSSAGSDFNYDFQVSATEADRANDTQPYNYATLPSTWGEMPGVSVFVKDDEGTVFHTYSAYARGLDILLGVHNFLDLTPKGRNETTAMDWVRHHDRYAA